MIDRQSAIVMKRLLRIKKSLVKFVALKKIRHKIIQWLWTEQEKDMVKKRNFT
jgi:hypothetical protein